MDGSYILFHYKDFHPLIYNILIIFANKSLGNFFVFVGQRFDALLMTHMNIYKFTVLND